MSNRVALIGLDGSGKSANIDIMKKDSDYSNYKFVWVRWKPTLLKPLYKLIGSKVNKKVDTFKDLDSGIEKSKNSEEQIKLRSEYNKKAGLKKKIFKNPIVRRVWMFLAVIDYFFQFYIKVISMLIRKDDMIFDRYYLDLFVDQGINFGYSPAQIGKEIIKHQWLFPKMTNIVYIRVQPETCYKRKDDIPNMDYLVKRFDIYEYLAKKNNWIIIDGEEQLDQVNKSIKKVILNK